MEIQKVIAKNVLLKNLVLQLGEDLYTENKIEVDDQILVSAFADAIDKLYDDIKSEVVNQLEE